MLAYAAHRRPARRLAPSTLLMIAGGHAAVFAAVLAIRMEVILPPVDPDTIIFHVPLPKPPTPPKPLPKAEPKMAPSQFTTPPTPIVPTLPSGPLVDSFPEPIGLAEIVGTSTTTIPGRLIIEPLPLPQPAIERRAARLLTPADRLRPPYPESKRRMEEEAVLRLWLAIGSDGRVTAVEPVRRADAEFLAAARTHLIRAWRYAPAKEGGTAVPSNLVITLRFELEDEV